MNLNIELFNNFLKDRRIFLCNLSSFGGSKKPQNNGVEGFVERLISVEEDKVRTNVCDKTVSLSSPDLFFSTLSASLPEVEEKVSEKTEKNICLMHMKGIIPEGASEFTTRTTAFEDKLKSVENLARKVSGHKDLKELSNSRPGADLKNFLGYISSFERVNFHTSQSKEKLHQAGYEVQLSRDRGTASRNDVDRVTFLKSPRQAILLKENDVIDDLKIQTPQIEEQALFEDQKVINFNKIMPGYTKSDADGASSPPEYINRLFYNIVSDRENVEIEFKPREENLAPEVKNGAMIELGSRTISFPDSAKWLLNPIHPDDNFQTSVIAAQTCKPPQIPEMVIKAVLNMLHSASMQTEIPDANLNAIYLDVETVSDGVEIRFHAERKAFIDALSQSHSQLELELRRNGLENFSIMYSEKQGSNGDQSQISISIDLPSDNVDVIEGNNQVYRPEPESSLDRRV